MPAARVSCRNYATLLKSSSIDREAGVIRGVAVITVGPALGHGMQVDGQTLTQVKAQAETYEGGLKVKLDHSGSAAEIVGFLRSFAIDGEILRADLHLLRSSPRREYILELAETIPDTFGLSISFSGIDEKKGEQWFARCSEIYSADIVSEPAANPSGLFQAQKHAAGITDDTNQNQNTMSPEDITKSVQDALSAAIGPITERLSKLEAICVPVEKPEVEMASKLAKAAELGALAALKEFRAALPPPTQFSPPAPAATQKKFEEIVRDLKAGGAKHNDAVRKAMTEHVAEYDSYRSRISSGEVIMF